MSAVSLKHLQPKPLVIPVLYALAGMRVGFITASLLKPEFHAARGWVLVT